jgi:ABC-type glycerol-3-phosphate transport system substrate-binding protein
VSLLNRAAQLKEENDMARAAMLAVLLAVGLTAACGGQPNSDKATVTLKIWDFSQEQTEFHKRVAAQYGKDKPGVKVEWREIAQADYKKALPLAFQSGDSPDIFFWSDSAPLTMATLLDQGWVAPLGDNGKVPGEFLSRWNKDLFAEGINVKDGKVYGFPLSDNVVWGPGYMFLNTKAFADAGLDAGKAPKTWSELKSACEQIKAKTPKVFCIASPHKGTDFQRIWYALSGAEINLEQFFDYRSGKFALHSLEAAETLRFIQELNNAKLLAPGTNAKEFSRQQFAAGQAAIYLDGSWMPSSLQKDYKMKPGEFTVNARPLPDTGAKAAMPRSHDGNKYWISSKSTQQAEAWKFLDWMTKPDGYFAREYYKDGYGTVAFSDPAKYAQNAQVKEMMSLSRAAKPWRVQVPVAVIRCPDIAKSKAFLDALKVRPNGEYEVMVDALNNNKDLTVAAKSLVDQRQQVLEDGLKKEAAAGLKVSIDCYRYPDWDYLKDYTTTAQR